VARSEEHVQRLLDAGAGPIDFTINKRAKRSGENSKI
jgi:hypothetical protein